MKNYELGGEGHNITVDYAKEDKKDSRPKRRLNESDNMAENSKKWLIDYL